MRRQIRFALLAPALVACAYGQTPGKAEFEVASIKINPPQPGFHFAEETVGGGPGTADPSLFRCSRCSLATLIAKAFNLQPYQFPERKSLNENRYDIQAKIPTGASAEEFSAMLQNLLKDRFGLTWHFQEKKMKGYDLVVAKDGPKLRQSGSGASIPDAGQHRFGSGEAHNHSGAMVFGSSASYRATGRTTGDLVRVLSDQIGLPIEDKTGLPGKYDISLRWSGNLGGGEGPHGAAGFSGPGHSGHEGGGGAASGGAEPSGPTLFDALQQQLGLRLVAAEQAAARLIVIDRVTQHPTEN